MRDQWINAGFIVFERAAFDGNDGQSPERDVLAHLAARKAVYGYRHHGFFKSVDTYKDAMEFEEMIEAGNMPWIVRS